MQTITAKAAARGKGQEGTQYPFYRCGAPRGDCDRGVTISAPTVEQIVLDAVREAIADVEGRASAEHNAREAAVELELAEAELDALIGSSSTCSSRRLASGFPSRRRGVTWRRIISIS